MWYAPWPLWVKLKMFFGLTGNVSSPLMIVAIFMQFPLLLVRYNQGLHQLMILDLPMLFFSTVSVVLYYGTAVWSLHEKPGRRPPPFSFVVGVGIGLAISEGSAAVGGPAGGQSHF